MSCRRKPTVLVVPFRTRSEAENMAAHLRDGGPPDGYFLAVAERAKVVLHLPTDDDAFLHELLDQVIEAIRGKRKDIVFRQAAVEVEGPERWRRIQYEDES